MLNKKSVKQSNNLATSELDGSRHQDFEALKEEYEDFPTDPTKGTFTLSNLYPYIFDTLAYVCTYLHNKRFTLSDGVHDVIERRNDVSETHFRTVLRFETFILNGLGKYAKDYKDDFKSQVFKFVGNPLKKKVIRLPNNRIYYTDPIRIDLISMARAEEFGLKEFTAEEKNKEAAQLTNISRSPGSQIEFVAIEYFKPLFESLITPNGSGTTGRCYFIIPEAFQAKIRHNVGLLKEKNIVDQLDSLDTIDMLTAMEARRLFLYLNLHCNGMGNYINIDVVECARSCFRTCLKTAFNGNDYVSIKNHAKIIKKIELAIYLYENMNKNGEMLGVKFLPVKLNQYKTNRQNFSIRVRYL